MTRTHEFSEDRVHRYTLWREWGDRALLPDPHFGFYESRRDRFVQFIGLNPSTADEVTNDPTVRRCINFAKAWGFGGMCMTNLFGLRATDPKVMLAAEDPIGILNIHWLTEVAREAALIVACWGVHGRHIGQDETVLDHLDRVGAIDKVHVLRRTKDGIPAHPLYLPNGLLPVRMFQPIEEVLNQ